MLFLRAYLYAYIHYVIFLSVVMHMHIKLTNTFGNWLITLFVLARAFHVPVSGAIYALYFIYVL